MIKAGIDIGSRTVKLVLVKGGEIIHSRMEPNNYDPISVCDEILYDIEYDMITATGYGRNLFSQNYDCGTITEIKAFAIGARLIFPSCRTILDIGGQDTKAISIDEQGGVKKFEMNDRCAAGTGKFLEIMATALGYTMKEFIEASLSTERGEKINSTCTVFAESEVISLLARGADRSRLAYGIHETIVKRSAAMLQRISLINDIAFVGGVAMNPCIHRLLERKIGKRISIPDNPQLIGAIGCAYYEQ
ncbi:MAG: acyl-CoA dehydratase activase [Spirochaetota bacterium]|nr:acyl-CoA dehydratase activase [Spirochaetota bacterium]